jgi:predicted Fe-S protein YdhL (DUF1289 family)
MSSPCVDVCRYDEATGWCLGCGMAKADKKAWKREPARRDAIRAALPARLASMAGIGKPIGKAAKRHKG